MIRSKNSVFVKIKELVKEIPEGKVSTYGNVANAVGIGNPRVGGWREQRRRLIKDGVKKFCGQKITDFENVFWNLAVKLKKK